MKERIEKLEAHVEALFKLTIVAHERFLFLRSMMINQQLIDRIRNQARGICFRQLRDWLYWGLVLEVRKICSDSSGQSPCIRKLNIALEDAETIKALEDKCVKNNREMFPNAQLRAEFRGIYSRFRQKSREMLASHSVGGYKTIRDKLIAHNELRKSTAGYDFFGDFKELKLKYRDERRLLETLRELVDDLLYLVRNIDFNWDTFFRQEEKNVCDFWEIESIDGIPPQESSGASPGSKSAGN
jgi:hypothetical protein